MTFDLDEDRVWSLDDDMMVQMHIPKKIQAFDPDLFTTKWFDYRRMTPLQATSAYIKAYAEIARDIYARDIDYERAKHIKLATVTDLFAALGRNEAKAKRKLTGFWRGRQVADALCMPYKIYIEHAFTYRMRRWQRAYLPQPEHLYHEYDVEKIQELWEELQTGRLYLPEDPAYLVQNYQNIPYQNDFHEWLFKQARLRNDEAYTLAQLINDDLMPIDKVANRVEPQIYERVETYLQ
ncbi:hypothetical protein PXK56_17940 [Phaeobacter gallaeciensis]|uniref:hypothetical protein n=1 Tax=Phaeobacter gallaeciensis TaxID=60890 RepID=UPI0023804264|nr:hypothetical protein [Phaeobacter gallaeciensis]MDE4297071.1 hypothetical protein [Phaeobacter gallaeciensis]